VSLLHVASDELVAYEAKGWLAQVRGRLERRERLVTLYGRADAGEVVVTAVLEPEPHQLVALRTRIDAARGYHALTQAFPSVHCFERELHEQHGVRFHLGVAPSAIDDGSVELPGGTRLPADLVVIGVGVAPRTALAAAAGLRVEDGILVDDRLRTSASDVYAAGDVARYPDPRSKAPVRIEHFAAAERQGQAAARAVLGLGGPYRDVPFFWSQHYDVSFSYVGHAAAWDRIETRGSVEARDFAAFYLTGGRVLAVVTVGRDLLGLRAERAIEAGDDDALAAMMLEV